MLSCCTDVDVDALADPHQVVVVKKVAVFFFRLLL